MPANVVRLSIVIAAWNGPGFLEDALMSLAGQADDEDSEIIVVSNFNSDRVKDQVSMLRSALFLSLPAETTVPVLRAAGIESARGEIVALLEDHCTLDPLWCMEITKAHELSYAIVGGSVENSGTLNRLNWAVYFYDYGKYMLPDVGRIVTALSGNNVSYKRKVLREVQNLFEDGFYETIINQELRTAGYELYLAPAAIIYHKKDYVLQTAVAESYHHGRHFAAMRSSGSGIARRVCRGALSVFLPALLSARIVRTTLRKRRHVMELIQCFPYLFLLVTAWSYGEFCGYLWAEGSSAARWK